MVEILDAKIEAANRATDREFRRVADKIARLARQCEYMGENDMGLLTEALAGKFHRATKLIVDLDRTLQQVDVELRKARGE
jgi:hypothetical protein